MTNPKQPRGRNKIRDGENPLSDDDYLRQKATLCLRVAMALSSDDPARTKLIDLAEDMKLQAEVIAAGA